MIFFAKFSSKNSYIVLIPLSTATLPTFSEGSIPICRIPALAKFWSIIPSLLPISTANGFSDFKCLLIIKSANSLKCCVILLEVDEKNA